MNTNISNADVASLRDYPILKTLSADASKIGTAANDRIIGEPQGVHKKRKNRILFLFNC